MMAPTLAAAHSTTGNPLSAGASRPSMTPNRPSTPPNQPFTTANQPSTGADRTGRFGAMTKKNAI